MQWNRLLLADPLHPMVAGLGEDAWVYFVHSYAPPAGAGLVASCDYGGSVVAAVATGRVWATQFHPEKSGAVGLALLGNFVRAVGGGAVDGGAVDGVPAGGGTAA
jgi:glutamine amidotransferase